jgi:hypothetical protein
MFRLASWLPTFLRGAQSSFLAADLGGVEMNEQPVCQTRGSLGARLVVTALAPLVVRFGGGTLLAISGTTPKLEHFFCRPLLSSFYIVSPCPIMSSFERHEKYYIEGGDVLFLVRSLVIFASLSF